MKVSVNTETPKRKLVAVIGARDEGVFLRAGNKSYYLDSDGLKTDTSGPLESLLFSGNRTPVYEGDSITIQF